MKDLLLQRPGFLSLVWILIILVLCATPGEYIPSSSWLELLSFDKLVHAGMFFVLTTLFFLHDRKRSGGKSFYRILYFLLSVLYGLSLEIMQAVFFRNRSADWKDMIANTAGCLIAVFCFRRFYSRISS